MVTSRIGEIDEVLSISYGADDYITKPYNPTILLLRIQNIFRRFIDKIKNYPKKIKIKFAKKFLLKYNIDLSNINLKGGNIIYVFISNFNYNRICAINCRSRRIS